MAMEKVWTLGTLKGTQKVERLVLHWDLRKVCLTATGKVRERDSETD